MDTISKKTLSVNEFCKAFGFGRTTCYKLFSSGVVRPIKVGRRTFVSVNESEDFLARLEAASKICGAK